MLKIEHTVIIHFGKRFYGSDIDTDLLFISELFHPKALVLPLVNKFLRIKEANPEYRNRAKYMLKPEFHYVQHPSSTWTERVGNYQ